MARGVREAESKLRDLFHAYVAAGEILAGLCARGTVQVVLEHASRGFMHLQERATELGIRVRVLALRHGDAVAFGHQLEGFKETDAFDFHDKLEQIATDVAAEAPVKLMAGMHGEERGLLSMKGAKAGVAWRAAGFLQAHVFTDDFDDVD